MVFPGEEMAQPALNIMTIIMVKNITAGNDNPHSPLVVTLPLILLAIPSVIIGYVAIEPMLYSDFFKDVIFVNINAHPTMHIMKGRVPRRIGNGVAQPAFACTLPCYCRCLKRMAFVRQTAAPAKIAQAFRPIYVLFESKYYLDALYFNVFAKRHTRIGYFFTESRRYRHYRQRHRQRLCQAGRRCRSISA